jgi:hypothetical protein
VDEKRYDRRGWLVGGDFLEKNRFHVKYLRGTFGLSPKFADLRRGGACVGQRARSLILQQIFRIMMQALLVSWN